MSKISLIKIDVSDTITLLIGDEITFKFDYNNFYLVIPLPDHIPYIIQDMKAIQESEDRIAAFEKEFPFNEMKNKILFEKFHGMVVKGKIHSFSRIDKHPLIKFDADISEHRDNKINTILQ